MRNVLLLFVNLLTCVLANVCSSNGGGGSIFLCRNASLDDLKYIPRYTRSLKFINSNIRSIPTNSFAKFDKLKSLSLVNCSIDNVESDAFKGLLQLRSLNLSRNALTRIGENVFNGLKSLTKLDLTSNMIESIEEENFTNTSNIELLDLRHNNLTRIGAAVLRPLSGASTLDVRFNKLRCLSLKAFNNTRLKWFYIGNNPWDEKCWANLTHCLYNVGIYYGKNQAFDTLTEDRLAWKASDQRDRELPSKEQAEEEATILMEAEGWKKFYESVVQEIDEEQERLEDLALVTEETKKPEEKSSYRDDEEDSEIGLVRYGKALILWILTVCKVLPVN